MDLGTLQPLTPHPAQLFPRGRPSPPGRCALAPAWPRAAMRPGRAPSPQDWSLLHHLLQLRGSAGTKEPSSPGFCGHLEGSIPARLLATNWDCNLGTSGLHPIILLNCLAPGWGATSWWQCLGPAPASLPPMPRTPGTAGGPRDPSNPFGGLSGPGSAHLPPLEPTLFTAEVRILITGLNKERGSQLTLQKRKS